MYLDEDEFLDIIKKTPLVSIDLIVRDENQNILLGCRKNRPAQGKWFVPGGRIRKDESIANACSRISQKELGVHVSVDDTRFLGVYEHLYDDNVAGIPGFGTHYVVLGHEVTLPASQLSPPTEQHTEYRWLSERQILQDPDVHENTKLYFCE